MLGILCNVPPSIILSLHPFRETTCLLFQFQKTVDVTTSEFVGSLRKIPDLVHFHYLITKFNCFLQLFCYRCSSKLSFFIAVFASLLLHGVSTGTTQREHQFPIASVGEYRMEEPSGRDHITLHQTKIVFQLLKLLCDYHWVI